MPTLTNSPFKKFPSLKEIPMKSFLKDHRVFTIPAAIVACVLMLFCFDVTEVAPVLVFGAVAAGATDTSKGKKKYDVGDADVTNMGWDDLTRERERINTIIEDLEGPDGANVTNMGADDAATYRAAVERLEAVANTMQNSNRGLQVRREAAERFSNAFITPTTPIHTQPVADTARNQGYEEGPAGEVAFLRDVVIAYNQKKVTNSDRFKAVLRRTIYNKLRDRSNPEFQPQVMNAIGDDEYSFHRWEDGGLLIPTQYLPGIQKQVAPEDMLSSLCYRLPMEAPNLSVRCRVDKNHATSYTGGTRVFRKGETQVGEKTKDKWEEVEFKANELIGEAAASKMLMRYSPMSLAAEIRASFKSAMTYKRMEEFLYGDGVGRPLGMFNKTMNPALLQIAREAAQGTGDIVNGKNVLRMRQSAFRYSECFWVCNQDLLFYIAQIHIESANNAGILKYWAPGEDGRPDTILGRPVLVTEHFNGITTNAGALISEWSGEGILGLFNPNEYAYGELYEEEAVSVHVRFSEREEVFLFVKADDGRSMWKSPLTPAKGKTLVSPFIVLKNS